MSVIQGERKQSCCMNEFEVTYNYLTENLFL